jgi:hypothetical protein
MIGKRNGASWMAAVGKLCKGVLADTCHTHTSITVNVAVRHRGSHDAADAVRLRAFTRSEESSSVSREVGRALISDVGLRQGATPALSSRMQADDESLTTGFGR